MRASVQFRVQNTEFENVTINLTADEDSGVVGASRYDIDGAEFNILQDPASVRRLGQELIKLADFAEGKPAPPSLFSITYPPGVR